MNLRAVYISGFVLILAGFVILVSGSIGSPNTSTAVVVFIGPVPLIFGSGPHGSQLILISLVASVVIVLLMYLSLRRWKESKREREIR